MTLTALDNDDAMDFVRNFATYSLPSEARDIAKKIWDDDVERCDVCDHLGMHCQHCDTDYDDGWPRGNCEDDPYVTGEDE